MKLVLSFLFFIISSAVVYAATCPATPTTTVIYYVAINEPGASNTTCNGLSPTNAGGANCPFKDFTAVPVREKLYKTAGGSSPTKNVTVKVRTGTYTILPLELFVGEPVAGIYINANGANSSEFVVLTNYNDEVVTFDGTCSLGIPECAGGKTNTLMEIYGDRVVVQGLNFTNASNRNAQIGAINAFFQCNTLTGAEDSVKNTTPVGPVTIYGNTFTGMVQAIDATTAQNWTVSLNSFSNGGKGVGFKFGAQNNTISENTFFNLTNEAISMGAGGSLNHINDYEATNIVANNNTIQNVGVGVQVLWCNGCQITNNAITGTTGSGIYLGSNEVTEQSGCRSGLGCLPTTGLVVTGNKLNTIAGNLFIAGKNPTTIVNITAGTNAYCATTGSAVFRYGTSNLTFTQWKTATGTDASSNVTCINTVSYYFSTSGNDAALVNSALTPWQTIDKIYNLLQNIGLTLNCGDSVFLNRGNIWTANDGTDKLFITNRPCTLSSKLIIGAYGSGAKPIIDMDVRTSDNALDIRNSSYITVENIEFRHGLTNQVLSSSNVIINANTFTDIRQACLHIKRASIGSPSMNVTASNNIINGCGQGASNGEAFYIGVDGAQNQGVIDDTSNTLIVGNDITRCTHECIEVKPGPQNTIIEHNYIHDVVLGSGGPGAISVAGSAVNTTVRYNRIARITGAGGIGIFLKGSGIVHNNIIYNNGSVGLRIENAAVDALVRKAIRNTVYGNAGACTDLSPGVGVVALNNICRANASGNDAADPLFTNIGAGDFTLSSLSSPAIDSGTDDGFPKNGALPTKGAFDPPRFSGCVVEDATRNRTDISFTNNDRPSILFTGVTGITVAVDGAPRTESAPTLSGTNIIRYTIEQNVIFGQTVTWAAGATSTITSNSSIGGSLPQRYIDTATKTCTNKVGGSPATYALTQSKFRVYRVPLVSGSLDPLLPVNTRGAVIQTGYVVATAQIDCSGGAPCPATSAKAQGSWDGASWFDLGDVGSVVYKILNQAGGYLLNMSGGKVLQEGSSLPNNVGFAGLDEFSGPAYPQQGQTIPGCLDATGRTATNKGAIQRTSFAIPEFTLSTNECLTMGALIKVDRPIVPGVQASILRIRWVDQTGAPFVGPYAPVEITIVDNQLGVGF